MQTTQILSEQKNKIGNSNKIGKKDYSVSNLFGKQKRNPDRLLSYPETISEEFQSDPQLDGIYTDAQTFEKKLYIKPIRPEPGKIYRCTKSFLWGETKKNNYYKLLSCGKEWCQDCGQMHSYAHDLKISPLLPKFRGLFLGQGQSIGYLIITVPKALRPHFHDKQVLNKFRTYWREKIIRYLRDKGLPTNGLTRYHWAGENGYDWHPHLNILFPSEWIDKQTFADWRTDCARWFKMTFHLDYTPTPNLYYNFERHDFSKIAFWISYVTRPTQTVYREENAQTITRFRNTAPFGKDWPPDPQPEEKPEDQGFELHADGQKEKILWRKKWSDNKQRFVPETVPLIYIDLENMELISRGFWKAEKIKPPETKLIDPGPENLDLFTFPPTLQMDCPF